MKLSIIIPCYNEINTISKIINKILNLNFTIDKEIILVDDCSNDGTKEIIEKNYLNHKQIKVLFHKKILVRVQPLKQQKK